MSVADSITSFKQLAGDPLTPGSVPYPERGATGKEEDDCNYDGSDGGDGDIGGDNDDNSGDDSDDTDDKQKINHRDMGQLIWPVRDFQMDTAACKIPQVVEMLLHFLSEAVTLFVSS